MVNLAPGQSGYYVLRRVVVECKYDLVNVITLHPVMGARTAKGRQLSQGNVTSLLAQVSNTFLI